MAGFQNTHDVGAELGAAKAIPILEPSAGGHELEHLRAVEKPALESAAQKLEEMGLGQACILGLYVPPDKTVVMEPGCRWHLRPATESEQAEREAERKYVESPEYRRRQQEFLKHIVD